MNTIDLDSLYSFREVVSIQRMCGTIKLLVFVFHTIFGKGICCYPNSLHERDFGINSKNL